MKDNMECEYADADGGISEAEARVLRDAYARELVQINEPPAPKAEPAPMLELETNEPPILATIRAELAIKSTRTQIAEALIERGIAPPVGKRKWTASTVSKIIQAHDLVPPRQPKKARNRVEEHIEKVGGTWADYWPEDHPLKHIHLLDAPAPAKAESHHIVCNPNTLLAPIVGYAVTPQQALANRPRREEEQ